MTVFQKRHACIFSRTLLSRSILGDLIAGVAVAGLLIPESMGYVCIAGLPAQTGLYATVMGLLAYAVSGSKHLVVSPASSAAAIVIHATAHLANFSEMRRYAKPKTGDLPPALTALVAVPTLGILPRLLLSVGLTLVVLLRDLINAHVVELGRIPGTRDFVDCAIRKPKKCPVLFWSGAISPCFLPVPPGYTQNFPNHSLPPPKGVCLLPCCQRRLFAPLSSAWNSHPRWM